MEDGGIGDLRAGRALDSPVDMVQLRQRRLPPAWEKRAAAAAAAAASSSSGLQIESSERGEVTPSSEYGSHRGRESHGGRRGHGREKETVGYGNTVRSASTRAREIYAWI